MDAARSQKVRLKYLLLGASLTLLLVLCIAAFLRFHYDKKMDSIVSRLRLIEASGSRKTISGFAIGKGALIYPQDEFTSTTLSFRSTGLSTAETIKIPISIVDDLGFLGSSEEANKFRLANKSRLGSKGGTRALILSLKKRNGRIELQSKSATVKYLGDETDAVPLVTTNVGFADIGAIVVDARNYNIIGMIDAVHYQTATRGPNAVISGLVYRFSAD